MRQSGWAAAKAGIGSPRLTAIVARQASDSSQGVWAAIDYEAPCGAIEPIMRILASSSRVSAPVRAVLDSLPARRRQKPRNKMTRDPLDG
jgi:hypothetical protein